VTERVIGAGAIAGTRTHFAFKAQGYHYRFVEGLGASHCAREVQNLTMADTLLWVWQGYPSTTEYGSPAFPRGASLPIRSLMGPPDGIPPIAGLDGRRGARLGCHRRLDERPIAAVRRIENLQWGQKTVGGMQFGRLNLRSLPTHSC
jgi:hypothetical protein